MIKYIDPIPEYHGVQLVLHQVAWGELNIYDVANRPRTPDECAASDIILEMYDSATHGSRYHPDDDFEELYEIVAEQLAKEYP